MTKNRQFNIYSMLPFLKQKPVAAGIMTIERKPDAPDEGHEEDHGLMSAARDLASAMEVKDYKGMAAAIKAAFEILDSEPHEEGPHTNEEPKE